MRHVVALSLCALLVACDHASPREVEHPAGPAAPVAEEAKPPPAPAPLPRTPESLATLLAEHDRLVSTGGDAAAIAKVRSEIDRVAGQKDAYASRLFWYTDLEEAKFAAKKSGKPILSLRLLGRLDEELSCANSRLFRVVLYANPKVSQLLRDSYVLHWSSERPAPQLTLDFGDGRVVKRTITGNSVHYVLDAQGRIVDAIPGMYGPAAFAKGLEASLDLARKDAELSDEDAAKAVAKYHTRVIWTLTASWRKHLDRVYGQTYPDYAKDASLPRLAKWPHPLYDSLPAAAVNVLTYSKADTEAPSLALLQPEVQVSSDWGDWGKLAAGLPVEHLDPQSRALLDSKHPRDWSSREVKALTQAELDKHLAQFEKRLTEEQLRNEYVFHGAIHAQLSKASRVSFASTNEFIYSRVFMTPQADAWLGLAPTQAITALADDGVVSTSPPGGS